MLVKNLVKNGVLFKVHFVNSLKIESSTVFVLDSPTVTWKCTFWTSRNVRSQNSCIYIHSGGTVSLQYNNNALLLLPPPPPPLNICCGPWVYRRTLKSEEIFGIWKPFKKEEKCFLSHLKSCFCSQDNKIFVLTFWSFRKTTLLEGSG